MIENKKYVFTGPPCSGKSSVFDEMQEHYNAWHFINEVARTSIKHFTEFEPNKLPWNNRTFFQNYIETVQLKNLVALNPYPSKIITPILYDRGLVDEIAYRNYFNLPPCLDLIGNCANYKYDTIFYFPLWKEIYKVDSERIETFEEAEKIDMLLRESYRIMGYDLIEVPQVSVKTRIEFIENIVVKEMNDEYYQ